MEVSSNFEIYSVNYLVRKIGVSIDLTSNIKPVDYNHLAMKYEVVTLRYTIIIT